VASDTGIKRVDQLDFEMIRGRNISDFLDDPDVENLHHQINWERTREL